MPTPLTDADKVLRNDTGIDIATNIASIASALTPSNITDLGDVNLTNPITDGQVIKYDTATQKWVNGLGNITMECDQAQYDAWKQSGQLKTNTLYVITDAPNLNATAQDISYDGSTDTAKDMIDNSLFNEAEPYKNNITYAIGDYCTHNGSLYQCISTIASAEEWTPSHWERTTLTKLQTTTYNVAPYGGVIVCLKVGRLVTVKGYNIGSAQNTPTGQTVSLATIAERYRPRSFTVNTLGFTGGSNNYNGAIGFSVGANGVVSLYGYSALTAGNFVATYIV